MNPKGFAEFWKRWKELSSSFSFFFHCTDEEESQFQETQIFQVYTTRTSCLQTNSNSDLGTVELYSALRLLRQLNASIEVITTFVLVGAIFIPIGLASLFASHQVVEIVHRYDVDCIPKNLRHDKLAFIQNSKTNKTCTRSLTVPKHMNSPVYIYYQLDNFYQNHRRYVKSRSDTQLRSRKSENDTSACDPEGTTSNGSPIVPCGLIAWSLFNDTYTFSLSQQEDLIVWMRTAALPTFRKLYGKIDVDLEANEKVTVVIHNNYNTYSFGGKKKLVLSTTSWIGGKNDFLGIAYLTVGGLCLFLAISFLIIYLVKPR
ncbi:ALA-interacting subunit 1-like protein [Cinnamomum micranthum f. kanehirae]|uniref:ALA-interacting subunit 1-like protein n=1 Tax=Cinnamomum micranthum f. kanehirae TaxID=337451 RepID=A0A443P1K5_9MAGN|nr:ALA-interacting subunit 1-like protein [Cinnamomum micranthum f. kanehirae]